MLNVLIVEDDLDLAKTILEYLELEDISCDHASNGVRGLNLIKENNYDVILLDINLPRMDGLSVCNKLRKEGNDTPILMITARDQLNDKIEGFHVGTDDYLVKPFELKELTARIHALSRRRSGQVQLLRCADLEMDMNNRSVIRNGQTIKLSPTSWRLLETLLRHSPNVVSKRELEKVVWGDEPPDSNSLKVHIFNLRKAIDNPFALSLLHTIQNHGFALRLEDENKN